MMMQADLAYSVEDIFGSATRPVKLARNIHSTTTTCFFAHFMQRFTLLSNCLVARRPVAQRHLHLHHQRRTDDFQRGDCYDSRGCRRYFGRLDRQRFRRLRGSDHPVGELEPERLGRRAQATFRRANRSSDPDSHESPLGRLQAAAVDRANARGSPGKNATLIPRTVLREHC